MSLGQNFGADAIEAFSGELYLATLTQQAPAPYDANNPTAPPSSAPAPYACEGIAFSYANRDVDGTHIIKGDYRVVLLRKSLAVLPATGDAISIPPPGSTVARAGRVIRVEAVTEAQVTLQVRGP